MRFGKAIHLDDGIRQTHIAIRLLLNIVISNVAVCRMLRSVAAP